MVSAREASYAIYGAWRLALFDAKGLQFFDNTLEAFWRSFWAAAIGLPGYALITLIRFSDSPVAIAPSKLLAVEGIAYVCGWFAFPLAMFYVAGMFDRMSNYYRYVTAYNWSVVLQITLMLAVVAIVGTGALPRGADALLSLAATVAILAYQWFIARAALNATLLGAFGIVGLDLTLSLLINGWAHRILFAGAVQAG